MTRRILFLIFNFSALCCASGEVENSVALDDIFQDLPPPVEVFEFIKNNQHFGDGIQSIINDYADKVIANIQTFMKNKGVDPMPIPDLDEGFEKKVVIITYHGEVNLTSGVLHGASTISRSGDVVVSYSTSKHKLQITVPITFNSLIFNYDYSVKIMDLGPTGGVQGRLSKVKIDLGLGYNFTSYNASVDSFDIANKGHIDIKFTGHILVDWLANLLSDVLTIGLNRIIISAVSGVLHSGLDTAVNDINTIIHHIINPNITTYHLHN